MTDIFSYSDYKKFINDTIARMPKKGRGQYKKISEHLRVSTVLISQIFNGDRHLNLEQAWGLKSFIGLTDLEADYFLTLVNRERAGTNSLKQSFEKRLMELKKQALSLKYRLPQEVELTLEQKAIFYSAWHYSAIRLLSAVEGYQTIGALAKRLSLPSEVVSRAVEFLVGIGLCARDKEGMIRMGPSRTHLEWDSPFIRSRQILWRLKGFESMENLTEEEIFYTGPMSISKKAMKDLRHDIMALVESYQKKLTSEKPDEIACLNIDLFKL